MKDAISRQEVLSLLDNWIQHYENVLKECRVYKAEKTEIYKTTKSKIELLRRLVIKIEEL